LVLLVRYRSSQDRYIEAGEIILLIIIVSSLKVFSSKLLFLVFLSFNFDAFEQRSRGKEGGR